MHAGHAISGILNPLYPQGLEPTPIRANLLQTHVGPEIFALQTEREFRVPPTHGQRKQISFEGRQDGYRFRRELTRSFETSKEASVAQ